MDEDMSIAKILTLLQSEYPNSFSNMDGRMMALKKRLWESEFQNDDITLVYAAVRLLMKESREFAPNIGHIRDKMRLLCEPEELTEAQAWALVSKACRNSLYNAKTEFDRLPPDVRRAVGTPDQLKAWAAMEEETVQSVVASNFRRSYRVQRDRSREMQLLPPEIRAQIGGIAGGMAMIPDEV